MRQTVPTGWKMRQTSRWWWPALVPVLVLLLLSACVREAPEARLRATVATLQQAIAGHDAGGVRAVLAEDFIGPDDPDTIDGVVANPYDTWIDTSA